MNTTTPSSSTSTVLRPVCTLITARHRVLLIRDVAHWTYRYRDILVHVERRGQEYFARPVNDDGETAAPVAISGTLDLTLEKAEDGIDWVLGDTSVIYGRLTIRTRKVGDLYTSHVESLCGIPFPEATAPTVQYSKILAASKWETTLHGYH